MRLHVKYPGAQPHEVELLGRVSIVGRDPSCDLVIHDVKCSRRHAVIETGPDGVTVRDSGSANGIYLNGQRVERTVLRPGDTLTLGEVHIQLLPEAGAAAEATLMTPAGAPYVPVTMASISEGVTPPQPGPLSGYMPAPPPVPPPVPGPPVVMAPAAAPPPPVVMAPPPVPPPPPVVVAPPPPPGSSSAMPLPPRPFVTPPKPVTPSGSYRISGSTDSGKLKADEVQAEMAAMDAAAAGAPGGRPLTVTMLAVLWMASVLLYLGTGVVTLVKVGGLPGIGSAVFCAFLALVSAVMALGLWMVKPWARMAQLVIAGIGILSCSYTLASAATLVYMLRPGVRDRFATGAGPGDPKEGLFTGIILGTVVLGTVAVGGLYALAALGAAGQHFPR